MGKMYRRWDKFEVQDVIARYLSGEDVQAIAEEYGRSVRSIDDDISARVASSCKVTGK